MFEEIIEIVKTIEKIKGLKELIKDLFPIRDNSNFIYKEYDILESQELFDVLRDNFVNEADSAAVYMQNKPDGIYLFAAYCEYRKVLPKDKNKYIKLKASGITKDVRNLFGDSEIVILR